MKPSLSAPVLEQIHKDYHALLKSETKFSIAELLNFNDFKYHQGALSTYF